MINDVLEQLAEDYFRHKGYFTQHNIKYRPNINGPAYSVHSDIDVIGILPNGRGINKVIVVSCKSWHDGLKIIRILNDLKLGNEKRKNKLQKTFRELAIPEWSKAMMNKIKELTGKSNFVFYLVCTSFAKKDRKLWEENPMFKKNLKRCKIKLLDMETMVKEVWESIQNITPAHSELSRLLQMIYHSKGKVEYK